MGYEETRRKIFELNKELFSLKQKKNSFDSDLRQISESRRKREENFAAECIRQSNIEKTKYVEQRIRPYEEERSELEKRLSDAKQKYETEKASLTEENLMANCSDKQSILAEVKEASTSLHQLFVQILGERFCLELEAQLQSPVKIHDFDKLAAFIAYFNSCELEIQRISKYSGKISSIANGLQDSIAEIDMSKLTTKSKADFVIVALILILSFLGFKYIAPIYAVMLTVGTIFNLVRHYKILKILLVQKAVRDNVQEIEEMLRQEVLEELNKRITELDNQFNQVETQLNFELDRIGRTIEQLSNSAANNFSFDDSVVRGNHNLELSDLDNRENRINSNLNALNIQLKEKTQQLQHQKQVLFKQLTEIQHSYLDSNVIGESYEFTTNFLQNVEDNRLDFFKHPETSSLFLYSDYENVQNFIRLILFQLRVKMNPFAFTVDIFDPITVGKDVIVFKPENKNDSPAVNLLFRVFSEESVFLSELQTYKEEIQKRTLVVLKEYSHIRDYNKFMLSIDSLAESYRFIFLIDPSSSILGQQVLRQQFMIGGELGIYYHVFMKENSFFQMNEGAIELLEYIQRCYVLTGKGAKPRAKSFLIEQVQRANKK